MTEENHISITDLPPQSLETEQAVLGSMMLDRDMIAVVFEIMRKEDFYKPAHGIIFETIIGLYETGAPVDMITVMERLDVLGLIDKIGGAAYLSTCIESTPTPANAAAYSAIVKEKSTLRKLIEAGNKITQLAYHSQETLEMTLARADKSITDIVSEKRDSRVIPIKQGLEDFVKLMQARYDKKGTVIGISSGFKALDYYTGGFQNSDLIIIAARPSMGKTSLGLDIAMDAAIGKKKPAVIFTLEMSGEQLIQRMVGTRAKIESGKLRTGFLAEQDFDVMSETMSKMAAAPLFIVDYPGITPLEIRAKARRMKNEYGIALVVIDYLQLIRGVKSTGRGSENRVQEVSGISRDLKLLARELDIPVIVLSQLSRAVEQRTDKRPILSDLRESGAIEQDADLVIFLYRDSYYKADGDKGDDYGKYEGPEIDKTEVLIAKHRNGPTGRVELGFIHKYATFVNLDKGGE